MRGESCHVFVIIDDLNVPIYAASVHCGEKSCFAKLVSNSNHKWDWMWVLYGNGTKFAVDDAKSEGFIIPVHEHPGICPFGLCRFSDVLG